MSQPSTPTTQDATMSDKKPNKQPQTTRPPDQSTHQQQTRSSNFSFIRSEILPDQIRKLFNQMMDLHENENT
jgi:hypothetical protein